MEVVYAYMYVSVYVHVCMCICVYVSICACVCQCICNYMCIFYVCVCGYVCMCIHMYVICQIWIVLGPGYILHPGLCYGCFCNKQIKIVCIMCVYTIMAYYPVIQIKLEYIMWLTNC